MADNLSQELKENASQIVKENITSNEHRFPYTQQSQTIFPDDPGGIGQWSSSNCHVAVLPLPERWRGLSMVALRTKNLKNVL